MFDCTTSGSALKWLSIVAEFTRECLCLKVARSVTSEDVIDALAELFAMRGVPEHIRGDNGPEFVAAARKLTTAWKDNYNRHRPHSSLGYLTPAEFAARCAA